MLRYLWIVGGLAGAFGLGYVLQGNKPPAIDSGTMRAPLPTDAVEILPPHEEKGESSADPSLILPMKLPDAEGVMFDASFQTIKGHFKEIAKPLTSAPAVTPPQGPMLSIAAEPPLADPKPLPIPVSGPELPPVPPTKAEVVVQAKFDESNPATLPSTDPLAVRPRNSGDDDPKIIPVPAVRSFEPPPGKVVAKETVKQWLNSRAVVVNFDVAKVGNSGVKATELWVRTSNQAAWELLDRKNGLVQSFPTYLPGEGDYCVAAVLVGGSGMRRLPDADALEVTVDMTPPTAKLLDVAPVPNSEDRIAITWKAEDKHFDEKPIRLDYSWDGKEWLAVTSEPIANSGSLIWKLPEGMNHEVRLRLSAVDRAGNVAESYLPEAVSIDRVVPQAKIRSILKGAPANEELPMPKVVSAVSSTTSDLTRENRIWDRFADAPPYPEAKTFDEAPTYPEDRSITADETAQSEIILVEATEAFLNSSPSEPIVQIENHFEWQREGLNLVEWLGTFRYMKASQVGSSSKSTCENRLDGEEHCNRYCDDFPNLPQKTQQLLRYMVPTQKRVRFTGVELASNRGEETSVNELVNRDYYDFTPGPYTTGRQEAYLRLVTEKPEPPLGFPVMTHYFGFFY